MKKCIILSALFLLAAGCSEAPYMLFNDIDRVQLYDIDPYWKTKVDIRYNFIYANDPTLMRDTVYLTVNTIGYPHDKARRVAFRQITEFTTEIILDEKGNLIDTLYHEVENKAVPGVHYVPMDDPELQKHLYVPAGAVTAQIPVILLRDPSLDQGEMRARLELVETEDFMLGERNHLSQTIYIADNYSRPSRWNTTYIEPYVLGKYSQAKHRLIHEVMDILVDDAFIDKCINYDTALFSFLRVTVWKAIQEFNNDPENIASGAAPMKDEDGDPILFPNM